MVATATRIVFGVGTVKDLGAIAKNFERRALVVTGRESHRAERALANLRASAVSPVIFSIAGEPDLATVQQGVALAQAEGL